MHTYARQPLAITRGSGARVTDCDGRDYIDLVAGIAVNVLGHCHPRVVAALHEQAQRLIHVSNLYYSEPQIELAERLVATAFPSRAFFCNSGAEANETAIKLARKWGRHHKGGAYGIVAAQNSFHGRTAGALSATGNARYREPFEPLLPGFRRVPFNDVGGVADAIDDSTCAVMLEPIQGESGVIPLDRGALRELRAICDEHDVLLVLDEIQTGMGRTGMWWACQDEGVVPDVMTVAKGLGAGVPIGAVLAVPRADVFEPGDHGSTFGGNPLACAVAGAVLRTIDDEGLIDNARRQGDALRAGIERLAGEGAPVEGVRGRGLMLGVALSAPVAPDVARASLEHGVIINAIGDRTLRLVPPLVITDSDVGEALERLGAAFAAAAGKVPA